MKSPEEAAARWKSNTAAATSTWVAGVQNTQADQAGRAIAALDVAARNFQDSVTSGRMARAIQASGGTANWKAKTEAKQGNFATGVNAGAEKQASAIAKILAAEAQIVAGLPARVPGNPQANLARVSGVVLGLHARKGTLKG